MARQIQSCILGIVGGVIGGAIGYFLFGWILSFNFYALVLPEALVGLGCSLLTSNRSMIRGILCGVAALILGLYTEWSYRPFNADGSLHYFLTHLRDLTGVTQAMLAIGAFLAFWLGKDSGYTGAFGERAARQRRVEDDA